jgi:small-conductance mechanosensitive channel
MGDDDYFVGARVVADGVEGVIVETKLQRTKIRTEDGAIVTLSNQKIEPKWLRVSESE